MTDWKVGDLAVCVCNEPDELTSRPADVQALVLGKVYTVTYVVRHPVRLGLMVAEQPDPAGFAADRFRKVQHDKPEACEEEFVTLLNRSKRKVGA